MSHFPCSGRFTAAKPAYDPQIYRKLFVKQAVSKVEMSTGKARLLGKSSNCCHQMMDFKAKMHQIRSRLGLRPRLCWVSLLQRSPDCLAGFGEPLSGRRRGWAGEDEGKGRGRKGGESGG